MCVDLKPFVWNTYCSRWFHGQCPDLMKWVSMKTSDQILFQSLVLVSGDSFNVHQPKKYIEQNKYYYGRLSICKLGSKYHILHSWCVELQYFCIMVLRAAKTGVHYPFCSTFMTKHHKSLQVFLEKIIIG